MHHVSPVAHLITCNSKLLITLHIYLFIYFLITKSFVASADLTYTIMSVIHTMKKWKVIMLSHIKMLNFQNLVEN